MWSLVALGIILAASYGKQKLDQLFQGLSVEPVDVEFSKNSLGLLSTRFTIGLKIFNKSNVPVPIQSVAGEVFFNGTRLAAFNIQQAFTIPGNGSKVVTTDITADNLEFLKSIVQIILQGTIPKISVKGGLFTVLGTAPINIVYNKIPLIKKQA